MQPVPAVSARWRDDRGSMPLAVLLSVMALAFTTLIASTVTRQILDTRSDVQRAQGIAAAQAGLDVAMARILSEHNEL